mmetsp:Transcript_9186/g.16117  ORF Transcript_9186/g.16117 Transcript_9186/m.16117 type:complete len:198 (-) Transcript_9186:92-685(-)
MISRAVRASSHRLPVSTSFTIGEGSTATQSFWRRFVCLSTTSKQPVRSMSSYKVQKTEEEYKKELTPAEYHVIREKGTERAFTGEYDKVFPKEGYFACRACGNPIYSADAKFNSGCGWPAFDKCYKGSIEISVDNSFGMKRIEIMCKDCGGHLGHVFHGEKGTDTNERHCVNSVSVKYIKAQSPKTEEEVLKETHKL